MPKANEFRATSPLLDAHGRAVLIDLAATLRRRQQAGRATGAGDRDAGPAAARAAQRRGGGGRVGSELAQMEVNQVTSKTQAVK